MKNHIRKAMLILNAVFCIFTLSAQAQTITFDKQDYKKLGVYDTWEQSPFRTGQLKGNVGITSNFLNKPDSITGESPNQSTSMLAVQRSRFGSNTFGARIDLQTTFELTPSYKYVHVMIHKPSTGRVMLVGLGKRRDRTGQSEETEQFWSLATTKVQANTWTDAVFAVKGNGGIDIYSLVVVPDCESPHNLTSDYLCYIDEIVVNNTSTPRFHVSGEYGINYDTDQAVTRSDRKLTAIGFSVASQTNQTCTKLNTSLLYNDLTAYSFKAKPGEVVTPTFTYSANWMSGYVYADWDNNGRFENAINTNGTPSTGSNLVTYSFYNNKNSAGSSVANGNVLNPPTFRIPSTTQPGFYRMRYKVDWNNIDPAGNMEEGNLITNNGGAIVDILLNVHGNYCLVNDANRNGEVLSASDGAKLVTYKTAFGKPFTIRMNPERGFGYMGIRVRHGYGLAGDSLIHNNAQYRDTTFSYRLFVNDEFTIPAECMDGDVEIEGLFVEKSAMPTDITVTYNAVDEEGNIISTRSHETTNNKPYPDTGFASLCSSRYFELQPIPEGYTSRKDTVVNLLYTSKFPFEVTTSLKSAKWYNLMLTASQFPLYNNKANKMALADKKLTAEESRSPKYLWCFMGNAFDGFLLVNALSLHEGYSTNVPDSVLTSSTTMTGTEGGKSYPVLRKYPFVATSKFSRGWFVETGETVAAQEGFYLGQIEDAANRMNYRDGYLSYWTGGAGQGSTFTIEYVGDESILLTGVTTIEGAPDNVPLFDLSGKRVEHPQKHNIYIQNRKKKQY